MVGRAVALPYETMTVEDVSSLMSSIARFRPDVIVTSDFVPGRLKNAAFELRRRWIHVDPAAPPEKVAEAVEACYAFNLWGPHPNAASNPLFTVYTAAFNPGDHIEDAYRSLEEQTCPDWEWVVVDDRSSDGTWERLVRMASEDVRVRPFSSGVRLGKIGAVKDAAVRLARGDYLVELDHDDMLVDTALAEIRAAFGSDPDVGMVYSNFAAFFEDGSPHSYEPVDGFWKGRYRWTEYRGRRWYECLTPDVHDRLGPGFADQFVWHLSVGPNHVRAFRASVLRGLGGYNAELPVADDWDLYSRFFLRSKCLRLDRMLYLYRVRDNWENATFRKTKSIQDHLALAHAHYAPEFAAADGRRLSGDGRAGPDLQGAASDSDVSVVVLEGQTTALTARCLASVRRWAPGAEAILVANGCEPLPEAAALADKVVRLEANVRFAAGMNRGAMEATRKILCLLNNDAAFVDDSLARLARALGGDVAVAGPYCNRAKPPQGDVPREAVPAADAFPDMVTGVCLAMPTALYRELGGFDPRLYTWEDDDLCARARGLGLRSRVVGGTYVEHERHATFKARGEDVHAVMAKNRAIFCKKNPRIRVVAIAKDEEAAIGDFFGQFLPLTRDFCLLDTGSSDGTASAARAAGATVEAASFVDFSRARNEALDRFAEGADWIVMLDPDERLDAHTIKYLKETLFRAPHDVLLAPLRAVLPDGTTRPFVPKPFCFRPTPEILWTFKVHEKLVGSRAQALVANAMIDHVIGLHGPERRARAEGLYAELAKGEPYFTDPAFRAKIREEWPILDYDKQDDPRIAKIHVGPLVSAVVPTYRRPDLVRRAVASVLAQDYANVEAIVVGDACPDLDASWWDDPRVRTLNLPRNHGAGGAVPRNYGIVLAAGGLIAYLDDDCAWKPDHVSSLYRSLRDQGAEFAFSSMEVEGEDLGFAEPKQGSIDTSCILHRKRLIEKHGFWKTRDEAGTYSHDWEIVSRWVSAGEKWSASRRPTLVYGLETCGQKEYLERRLRALRRH